MNLDVITAWQTVTCAIIHTECSVFIPDEFAYVLSLLNHMRTQVNALSDLTPSLENLLNQWFRSWCSWWEKLLLTSGIIILICVFSCVLPILLLWYLPPARPDSHQSGHLHANETPC